MRTFLTRTQDAISDPSVAEPRSARRIGDETSRTKDYPDRDRLAMRFERFKALASDDVTLGAYTTVIRTKDEPDRDRLAMRFERFKELA
ncbi:hypothetical protein [Bradyrhizobium japonicum]|uniref:hypothetical protein n=1 Tax=Bradyrhizobium japonicum TaxID=375 RepID=UPI001BADB679|nr:hypothetical protein [Bradyrhizobium japonicum]MBR0761557.1 hypothetical protein [Bradyrhizobium japonicum]